MLFRSTPMCGIAGIISLNQSAIDASVLKKMTDAIKHRGPDGEGLWLNKNETTALGHRRLSIIDLSDRASQPMHFNNRYTITFNGEIYNYIEIKTLLIKQGYSFLSDSDTEVLLALYDLKKEKCLEDLDGMFAFVIWDEQEQQLFCARDRFGEKPFYFHYEKTQRFLFASEMKALWAAGIKREINDNLLFNYLAAGVIHNSTSPSETFFNGITKLEAGHFLTLDRNGTLNQKRYWDINYNYSIAITESDASEQFRSLMLQSVMRRLRADVPVGSSLSGGLDSSLIVCLIDQLNADKRIIQNTFSARFKDYDRDEGRYMQLVINQTNVNPHFVYPDENKFLSHFDAMLHQDRKSTRLNSSHVSESRMPSSA